MTVDQPPTVVDGPPAACRLDDTGELVLDLPATAATDPRLCLQRRPTRGRAPDPPVLVPVEPGGAGAWRAALPAEPLPEGRWDLHLLDGPDDTVRRRLRSGRNDLRGLLGRRPPVQGPVAVRIPYPTRTGHLALRTWLRPVHAESAELTVGEATLEVRAELVGAQLAPGARALARCRGRRDLTVAVPLTVGEGQRFAFRLPYQELLDARVDIAAVWDLWVSPAPGAPPARIGRLLDDVADKKPVFVYPAAEYDEGVLRPYFTIANDLSVEVGLIADLEQPEAD